MENNEIDYSECRKFTHIAGIDVDRIINQKGECVLTIKDAFLGKDVDVSGTKKTGIFLSFVEPQKDMVCNATNCERISKIVMNSRKCSFYESRLISNWVGVKIRLLYDPTIKMMGKVKGGIVVDTTFCQVPKLSLAGAKQILSLVHDRESFEAAQKEVKDFFRNQEIYAILQDLAKKYPKTEKTENNENLQGN